MTPFPNPADDRTEEQAAHWAARLDGGELSVQDRSALETWLTVAPGRRALLSAYCQFSADLEQQMPLLAGIRVSEADPRNLVETARPLPWLRRPILAGVMLTTAAAVALLLWVNRTPMQDFALVTPVAQRRTMTLADGTLVELNAQTSLRVDLKREVRQVRLASGEAFFTVTKDSARPFIVETPAGSVRVTGTRFDIRSESPTALEVTVDEGTVQVRAGGQAEPTPHVLHPGDHLSADAKGVTVQTLPADALAEALAWRKGQAVFAGTPLRDALARFARYHGRGFIASPSASDLRVGGRYSLDDADGFLAALEEVLPVKVTRDLSGTVQVSLRSEH